MGTRSLTRIHEGKRKLINMYRQYDGYPEGHGKELFEFLNGFNIVNGLGVTENRKVANGAGCLAAQLVAHFKTKPGGFYLFAVTDTDCDQEYEYIIDVAEAAGGDIEGGLKITVKDVSFRGPSKAIFSGNVEEFGRFCNPESTKALPASNVKRIK